MKRLARTTRDPRTGITEGISLSTETDGYERQGRVFCLRLSDVDRGELEALLQELVDRGDLDFMSRPSLGAFLVYAARAWADARMAEHYARDRKRGTP